MHCQLFVFPLPGKAGLACLGFEKGAKNTSFEKSRNNMGAIQL